VGVELAPGTNRSDAAEFPDSARPPAREPNPARSAIELRYELSTDEHINLDVLDIQGRLMRRLRNGAQPAGVHSVVFDRRDDGGGRLASGVYLVRLRTRTEARVTRIVILP